MASPEWVRKGARSEYLGQYFLSRVGYVVPVPYQEDRFKVDFIVHLAKEESGGSIPTGKCFAIQIKSSDSDEKFEGDGLRCLWESGLPYFWGVVSMDGLKFSIYTTLSRFCFMWMIGRAQAFTLCPRGEFEDFARNEWDDGKVWTGPAILELDANDLDNAETKHTWREIFFNVMAAWVDLEAMAISWKQQRFPMVMLPSGFKKNDSVFPGFLLRAIANPNTLPMVCNAVQYPLYSLGYYLHSLLRDHEDKLDPETVSRVKELDSAVEQVKKGAQGFASDWMDILLETKG